MFFLVVAMLLCRGVAYAYSPSANDPISKSGGIEQVKNIKKGEFMIYIKKTPLFYFF